MVQPVAIVVDDDSDARGALCSFLKHERVEAAEAGDGVAGLELFRSVRPDLAFLDVQLPLLDGLSLLKLAKDLQPILPVIMMSGGADPAVMRAAMENGAYTFICKPCDFERLERIVQAILTKHLPEGYRRVAVATSVPTPGEKPARETTPARPAAREKGGRRMAIVRWSPFRELVSLQQEMNRLFEDMMTRRPEGAAAEAAIWVPAVDVSEREDAITVRLEVPGVKKEDIKISVTNNILTVKGEKRMEKDTTDESYHRVERVYGTFVRSLELPTTVAADQVKAAYGDGVLTITLPKSEEVRPKEIPIEA